MRSSMLAIHGLSNDVAHASLDKQSWFYSEVHNYMDTFGLSESPPPAGDKGGSLFVCKLN